MINKLKSVLLAVTLSSVCSGLMAAEPDYEKIKQKLATDIELDVDKVEKAPIPGLLQAYTSRGIFYLTADGKYLIHGKVYNVDEGFKNETEGAMASVRLEGLEAYSNSTIDFKAKDEEFSVTVFTDTTCGYCRKLHAEMKEYNDLGITVKYLAFPRGGIPSQSYSDLEAVWCAKDPKKAMTTAKLGESLDSKSCATKIEEHYKFGTKIGINGTPAIILQDGTLIPGYQPPKALKAALQRQS